MKPASFEYYKASNLNEVLQFISEHGEECKIIAGGQSLVPMLNMRIAQPDCLIDINDLSVLDYIREDGKYIVIGALTRQMSLETNEAIQDKYPVIIEAVRNIGHPQTRRRGTVGGSLAHAEPSAEIPLVLLALDSEVILSSISGSKTVPLNDFLISEFTTSLEENEILTEVRFRSDQTFTGYAFDEFAIRKGDFAIAASVCLMHVSKDKKMHNVRICMSGLDSRPIILNDAEKILENNILSDDIIYKVSEVMDKMTDVSGDANSSREYKIDLAKVLINTTVTRAYYRALTPGDIK